MPDISYAWAPITKMEKADDGTLLVYGPAASPDLDRDQQRLNADWLDQAMPAWFSQGGNVREQHDGKRAVGVGVGLSKADGDLHMLAARIVDPVAVLKCEHGVLKGFSVGIKNPKITLGKADAPGGEIVGGDIIEVSVVDRPCNPTTLFEIAKADGIGGDLEVVDGAHVTEKSDAEAFGLLPEVYDRLPAPVKEALTALAAGGATVSAETVKTDDGNPETASPSLVIRLHGASVSEEMAHGLTDASAAELDKADLSAAGRKKAAASGAAMSDGSYPISTKADLRKAVKAVGRGGADHNKIRAHIVKRAKALGLEALVPDNWNPDGSIKAAKADEPDAEAVAKAEEILRNVRAVVPDLVKADDGAEGGDIASAESAIACIAKLIIAEAESLAMGNLNEAMDISLLLDAVRSLAWFKAREESEQDGDGDADMGLADQPDITKTDTPEAPARPAAEPAAEPEAPQTTTEGEPAASEPPADAVTKADVAELLKAAVAEVTEAAQEREKALAAELTKAQQAIEEFRALPTPGGPALTRTSAQQATARGGDADLLRQEAAALKAKADQVSDRDLRDGYLDRAKALLVKADA
ncbi:hypothetical protein ACIO6U_02585 [Streptomyces sp. NPDC087422]|uniref:hypothetical protein n=1 Tax=Streptomyces sp. NPDC087422 TaxID=3365786 RepID=UPI00382413D5